VLTEAGSVQVSVPRDRDASFAPAIVAKRQRRLTGVDDLVISLVAKGLTTGEVQAHLAEIYGAQVSRDTISTITDRVLEGLAEWQSRPLDPVYAVLFIDVINVKIRDGNVANRPIYVILGVTADGERDIVGLWAGEHGDGEGAKYWLRVLAEVKNRGTRDVLMVVCDGLKGLPDAIAQVWPQGRHPDMYRAPAAEQLPVCQPPRLGGDRQGVAPGLHRAVGGRRAGRVRRVQRHLGGEVPGHRAAVGERLGGVRPVPGLR
jgi:transposase-like protein